MPVLKWSSPLFCQAKSSLVASCLHLVSFSPLSGSLPASVRPRPWDMVTRWPVPSAEGRPYGGIVPDPFFFLSFIFTFPLYRLCWRIVHVYVWYRLRVYTAPAYVIYASLPRLLRLRCLPLYSPLFSAPLFALSPVYASRNVHASRLSAFLSSPRLPISRELRAPGLSVLPLSLSPLLFFFAPLCRGRVLEGPTPLFCRQNPS